MKLTMPDEDFLILPGVKNTIGILARIALAGVILSALLAVAEILLLSSNIQVAGIICGMIGSLIMALEATVLSILAIWCHRVLLFQRGSILTACLSVIIATLGLAWPICLAYSLLAGKPLLANQALLPLLVYTPMLFILLVNLPNMAAASRSLKIRLGIFPVLMLLIYICDQPGCILIAAIGKLLLWVLMAHPLRQLAGIAPRVISMPPTETTSDEERS